jgi:hypoxia up-regulated 1
MMTLKICLLVLTSFYIAEANVLGIDFGSEFFKVALISPGKSFIIIENTNTKRKTDNVVAFAN